jgi:hypothetical protein
MRTYQIARRAVENLFDEVNTIALGRQTDRMFQAIKEEISGWWPRPCDRKISQLGSVIPPTTASSGCLRGRSEADGCPRLSLSST